LTGRGFQVRIFDFSEVEAEVNHFWLAGYPEVNHFSVGGGFI